MAKQFLFVHHMLHKTGITLLRGRQRDPRTTSTSTRKKSHGHKTMDGTNEEARCKLLLQQLLISQPLLSFHVSSLLRVFWSSAMHISVLRGAVAWGSAQSPRLGWPTSFGRRSGKHERRATNQIGHRKLIAAALFFAATPTLPEIAKNPTPDGSKQPAFAASQTSRLHCET